MTAFTIRRPSRRPLVVVIGILAIAIGTQVASVWNGDQAGLDEPLLAAPPPAEIDTDAGTIGAAGCERRRGSCPDQRGPPRGRECGGPRPRSRRPDPRGPGSCGPGQRRPQGLRSHRRAHPDPRRRRLLGGAPDGPPKRHRVRREAGRVRRRRGPPDRRRDRLPARRAGRRCRRSSRSPATSPRSRCAQHPRVLHRFPRPASSPAGSCSAPLPTRPPWASSATHRWSSATSRRGHRLFGARRSSQRLRRPGPRRSARLRRRRPGRRGGRRPHRGGVRDPRRSRATRWLLLRHAGRDPLASGDPAGARAAYEAALAVRPDLPAALVGLAKLDAFEGDLSPAIASSTRPSPRSRCPTRWRAGRTC